MNMQPTFPHGRLRSGIFEEATFAERVALHVASGMTRDMATALVLIEAPLSVIPGGAHATLGARF